MSKQQNTAKLFAADDGDEVMIVNNSDFSETSKISKSESINNKSAMSIHEIGSNDPLIEIVTTTTTTKKKLFNDSIRFHIVRLLHWGPLIALFIILYIFAISIHCISILWPFNSSFGAKIHIVIYVFQLYLVLSNYFAACFTGPGFVDYEWKPFNKLDCQYLQYCSSCEGFKPPRAHHCRKCDRCVMKMDHHCPWINTCCGHFNHGYFVKFLFFAPVGCVHSVYILCNALWSVARQIFFGSAAYKSSESRLVVMNLVEFVMAFFALGLALGVIIAVGMLFVVQIRSIIANETGIENYIANKAKYRREELKEDSESDYANPYHLGKINNLRQVITFNGATRGNGYDWPTRSGFGRFYMTIEQLKQKREKLMHSQNVSVKFAYNGNWFPCYSQGWRITCSFPLTDEPRLMLFVGEIVRVTRWRKHWLYGQVINSPQRELSKGTRYRGWFPRRCVVEAYCNDFSSCKYDVNATGDDDKQVNNGMRIKDE